ncbi:UNVERIFIED_CONTAM: hypothetical protein GTU68_017025 [Idotea baltica]|nr:hypothetical protein [Idotea baltica]
MHTLEELAKITGSAFSGDKNIQLNTVAPLAEAKQGQISFVSNPKYINQLKDTGASAVILNKGLAENYNGNALINDDPYLTFAKVLQVLYAESNVLSTIHESAVLASTVEIHKSANIGPNVVIDEGAKIAENTVIGAGSYIGKNSNIAKGVYLYPNAVIEGPTTIGKDNKIFQFASVGAEPQDKKYKGEPTTLTIGDRNVIRESCTINRGTAQDIGTTTIGDDNWIMAYVHIAHDCVVGNNTIFANNTTLAGHVTIHDYAILGGFTLVHQFCHVGEYSFTGMGTALGKDLPPYVMAFGAPGIPRGINAEGLKRNGFTEEQRKQIKDAYKTLYRKKLSLEEAVEILFENDNDKVQLMAEFCKKSQAARGIIR